MIVLSVGHIDPSALRQFAISLYVIVRCPALELSCREAVSNLPPRLRSSNEARAFRFMIFVVFQESDNSFIGKEILSIHIIFKHIL